MSLDGKRYRKLETALLSAFPSESALSRLVRFHLDESLAAVAGGANLRDVTFNLIEWAISQNRLEDLIRGAREEAPFNEDVEAVDKEMRQAQPPRADVGALGPLLRWADQNGQLGQLIALACGPGGEAFDVGAFTSGLLARATDRASVEGPELLAGAAAQPSTTGPVLEAFQLESFGGLESMGGLESLQPRGTPRSMSAPTDDAVRVDLIALAAEYDTLEASKYTSERTRLKQRVASQMRMLAPRAESLVDELASSEEPGQRLAAVMLLQESLRSDRLLWLADRMARSEQPFIAYQAALALRSAAREAEANREAVRSAIERGLDLLKAGWPKWRELDRTPLLEDALAALDRTEITPP